MAGYTISDVIEHCSTEALRPHESNDRIYGVERDEDLIESIVANGILEALIVTGDGTIIGGHRRWRSAVAAGLDEAPCRRIDGDELALRRAVVDLNRQREKTNQMRAREALELIAVEELEARRRMEEGGKRGGEESGRVRAGKGSASDALPFADGSDVEAGQRSSEVVADAMGISARTVDAYVTVGRTIEALDSSPAADAPAKAAELRKVLDERGPAPAATLAREYAASDTGMRQRAVSLLLHGDEYGQRIGETEVARRLGIGRTQVREWHIMATIAPDDPLIARAVTLAGQGVAQDDIGPQIGASTLVGRCYVRIAREQGLIAALPEKKSNRPKKPKVKDYPTAGLVPAEKSVSIMRPTRKTGGAWAVFIMSIIEFLRMAAEADGEDIWRQWPEDSRERVAARMDAMAAELSRLAGKIRAIRLTLVK